MSNVPVTVIRTKNRHSRAVLTDHGIEIRLARRLPQYLEREHIDSLTKSMQRLALIERQKTRIDPFAKILDGTETSITLENGHTYVIERRTKAGARPSIRYDGKKWLLTADEKTSKTVLHRLLWRALSAAETEAMEAEVHAINDRTFRLPVGAVRLRHTVSQWGSCRRDGRICLSTSLLFVPAKLREYVIVHELAHIEHRNHGVRFWKLIESVLPDFRDSIRNIKQYRVIRIR